ncbi:hypothetical protein [Pseudoalteromonas rubra]|jgi:hypothetical protein|nr:hypothetical protein [Pseudoalteromonas rubra]
MKTNIIPKDFLKKISGGIGGPVGSPGIPPKLIDPGKTEKLKG